VAGATPCPKNGVVRPPHFWPRGGWPPPYRPYGGGRSHPQAFGGGLATLKGQKKKKKKEKWFWDFGGDHPIPTVWGWLKPPPKSQTHFSLFFFFFFFFFLMAFRGGRTTLIRLVWGGRSHPLAKNGVVRPPHFLGKGWLQPPPISLFLLLLFFFNF
jgi:hypothetical protein